MRHEFHFTLIPTRQYPYHRPELGENMSHHVCSSGFSAECGLQVIVDDRRQPPATFSKGWAKLLSHR